MPLFDDANRRLSAITELCYAATTLAVQAYNAVLQRWSPRGHILKSLALASKVKSLTLASKPQVLENCPVLGSRTALFFEHLKFCWKTPETSRKICEYLFCFRLLEHRRSQGERAQGARHPSPQLNFHQ